MASRIFRVERVKGAALWIKDEKSSAAGWVTPDWLVPYDEAIDYSRGDPSQPFERRGLYRSRPDPAG